MCLKLGDILNLSHKETLFIIKIVDFALESLVFQNRPLNGAHLTKTENKYAIGDTASSP